MYRLLHLTDTHLFASPDAAQRGVVTQAGLERVLAAGLAGKPDGILVSGDLSQDETRESYARLRAMLEATGVPVFCLPGNHDDLALMHSELASERVAVLGDHSLGHWRLLTTDCTIPGAVHGEFGEDRLAAIDRMLGEVPTQPTLVALHHPPLDCGSRWLDQSRLADGAAFLDMVCRHAQVRGVLCGHIHQPLDRTVGGVRVLATPSTCRQFRKESDGYAVDDLAPGWRWLELGAHNFETRVGRIGAEDFEAVRA